MCKSGKGPDADVFSPTPCALTAMNTPAPTRFAIDCRLAYELDAACDFIFMIHVADTPEQRLVEERLELTPNIASRLHFDVSGNRVMRLQAPAGALTLNYRASVDRVPMPADLAAQEMRVNDLPDDVLPHLLPTRYCESDLLSADAQALFGQLPPGHSRVQAVSDWIGKNIEYKIGSTVATTTARDVFMQRAGVCRDFAHLAITFCRALNIPARLVCGYSPFETPPPDFHAVFEAFIGGRWVMFDPTGLAPVASLIRVATGRDAKDVAFATIFGPARMTSMSPEIERIQAAAPAAATALA